MPVIKLDYNNTKISDTYLNKSAPTSQYSTAGGLSVGKDATESLIKFDLGLIPNDAIITSAVLAITSTNTNRDLPLKILAVGQSWAPSTATWNNKPIYEETVYATALTVGSGPLNIDLKSLVQEWVNGKPNYGIAILNESTTGWGFHSNESSTTTGRPVLTIEYSLPETKKTQVEFVSMNNWSPSSIGKDNVVTLPTAIQAGDVLFSYVEYAGNVNLVMPEGWNLLSDDIFATSTNHFAILWKKADGTETTLTLSFDVAPVQLFSSQHVFRNVRNVIDLGPANIIESSNFPYPNPVNGLRKKSYVLTATAQAASANGSPALSFKELTDVAGSTRSIYVQGTYNHDKTSYENSDWSITIPNTTTSANKAILLEPITNQAPNTPPINNPKGTQAAPAILTTSTPTLDWSFSDPDAGDKQGGFALRIKKASDGSIIHYSGWQSGDVTDYTVPAGIIQKNVLYYWEVQTYDMMAEPSSWSSPEYFKLTDQAMLGDVFTFNYTGAAQPFTVPGNVMKIKLEAWGGQGGTSSKAGTLTVGGKGGYAKGELAVNGGQVLNIYVGGKGGISPTDTAMGGVGGWNGGGEGGRTGTTSYGGGGGGGASDVRTAATLESRILVAAGGGGAAAGTSVTLNGGAGGGLVGETNPNHTYSGYGATQTAGGEKDGKLGIGGSGYSSTAGNTAGGGGGGGYYGGGGSRSSTSPGGGGSSYIGTLSGGETLSGQREGDGLVKITILEVSNPPTVINREPGSLDQLQPEGASMAPLFTWDYSGDFIQAKYQVKVFDNKELLVHDSGLVTSTEKFYQVPSGTLEGGKTYSWELTVTDVNNVSYPTPRLYFITNQPPGAVVPENPVDNYRTGLRPTFWGTIGNDVEDDPQKFVIQIAEDSSFTQNVQERNSETSAGDWQVKTKDGVYGPFPAEGVGAEYEGGTIKYTWSAELTEGKTYYWRMAGIDATTGARGTWSAVRRIRVGNRIDVSLKNPVTTTAAIHRLLIRAQYTLATDGANPATVKFEACNNAFDENPTWEDVTDDIKTGEYHIFTNDQKTAENWGFNIRAIFEANDSLDPIEFYGFGISFD